MPTYSSPGTDPLGSDPTTKAGERTDSPSAKGKDAGGDATNATTLSSPGKASPKGSASTPKGVQSFNGEAV